MKVSELKGAALDWAVTKLEFPEPDYCSDDWLVYITEGCNDDGWVFNPSTDWAQAGPIIEREGIQIQKHLSGWVALPEGAEFSEENYQEGETPLIASMRCYVEAKLGDEIEVPEEVAA